MKVLLTGASGYLGSHIMARLPSAWQTWACYYSHPIAASRPYVTPLLLDIADRDVVQATVRQITPDLILHTAIARDPADFDAVIVNGSANIAAAATAVQARLIHLSTDVIFDGSAGTYDETAFPPPKPATGECDPLPPYGRAKARAEGAVLKACPEAVIVRTSLIYGFEPLDHSTRWLAAGLEQGHPVTLFTDQIRCPIHVDDLAASLIELAGLPFHGVVNIAGPVAISRYDFGRLLCRALNLDASGIVGAATPEDAPWAKRLILDDSLASSLLQTRRRSPEEVCLSTTRDS